MNYKKHYERLMDRAKKRHLTCYVEKHHIIPRCMNGTDKPDNIVDLTPEEHYVAHQLLVKMYPEHSGLLWAAILMTGHPSTNGRVNNRMYGWLKRRQSKIAKQRTGCKNGSYGRSWYYDPTTFQSGKFSINDVPNGWVRGRKLKTSSTIEEERLKYISLFDEFIMSNKSMKEFSIQTKIPKITLYKKFNKYIDGYKEKIIGARENIYQHKEILLEQHIKNEYSRMISMGLSETQYAEKYSEYTQQYFCRLLRKYSLPKH